MRLHLNDSIHSLRRESKPSFSPVCRSRRGALSGLGVLKPGTDWPLGSSGSISRSAMIVGSRFTCQKPPSPNRISMRSSRSPVIRRTRQKLEAWVPSFYRHGWAAAIASILIRLPQSGTNLTGGLQSGTHD